MKKQCCWSGRVTNRPRLLDGSKVPSDACLVMRASKGESFLESSQSILVTETRCLMRADDRGRGLSRASVKWAGRGIALVWVIGRSWPVEDMREESGRRKGSREGRRVIVTQNPRFLSVIVDWFMGRMVFNSMSSSSYGGKKNLSFMGMPPALLWTMPSPVLCISWLISVTQDWPEARRVRSCSRLYRACQARLLSTFPHSGRSYTAISPLICSTNMMKSPLDRQSEISGAETVFGVELMDPWGF